MGWVVVECALADKCGRVDLPMPLDDPAHHLRAGRFGQRGKLVQRVCAVRDRSRGCEAHQYGPLLFVVLGLYLVDSVLQNASAGEGPA